MAVSGCEKAAPADAPALVEVDTAAHMHLGPAGGAHAAWEAAEALASLPRTSGTRRCAARSVCDTRPSTSSIWDLDCLREVVAHSCRFLASSSTSRGAHRASSVLGSARVKLARPRWLLCFGIRCPVERRVVVVAKWGEACCPRFSRVVSVLSSHQWAW